MRCCIRRSRARCVSTQHVGESPQRNGQSARRLYCRAITRYTMLFSPNGQCRVFCLFPEISEVWGVHIHSQRRTSDLLLCVCMSSLLWFGWWARLRSCKNYSNARSG